MRFFSLFAFQVFFRENLYSFKHRFRRLTTFLFVCIIIILLTHHFRKRNFYNSIVILIVQINVLYYCLHFGLILMFTRKLAHLPVISMALGKNQNCHFNVVFHFPQPLRPTNKQSCYSNLNYHTTKTIADHNGYRIEKLVQFSNHADRQRPEIRTYL